MGSGDADKPERTRQQGGGVQELTFLEKNHRNAKLDNARHSATPYSAEYFLLRCST